MITFPNIQPEIFSVTIGSFELALRWYALSYILGFMCALYLMKRFILREKLWPGYQAPMTTYQAASLLTYIIIGVIIGGRLGYVLFYNLDYYLSDPVSVIRVWDGGMAFHGGFIGVVLAVILYSKINQLQLWSVSDLIAISTPPGLFFGRIANFVNAELWGKPTNMPWGVVFPGERAQDCELVVGMCARHPSQLYEAGLEGLVLFFLLVYAGSRGAFRRPGVITAIFSMGYGGSRFFVEYFRVPDPQFFSASNPFGFAYQIGDVGITMGQALSLPMIIAGSALIVFRKVKNK